MGSDGRLIKMRQQTGLLQVSIHTPWEPVAINLSFAVITGTNDVLVLSTKTLKGKLDTDVTQSLKVKALASREAGKNQGF